MTTQNNLSVLISHRDIQAKIEELAQRIDDDHEGKELVVVFLLAGAIFFGVDLVRKLKTDTLIDTLSVSSYSGTETTGVIKINSDLKIDVSGKHVLIVEDIIDTGLTLESLQQFILQKKPAGLKIACLLNKEERRIAKNINVDYSGFIIDDLFVVGYGLDFNQKYRSLRDICVYSA